MRFASHKNLNKIVLISFKEFKDNWQAVYTGAFECIQKDWQTFTEFFNTGQFGRRSVAQEKLF